MNCHGCGNILENEFHYCPQCGRPVDGVRTFGEILDRSFARLAQNEASCSVERLAELDEDLRVLENELDDFAQTGQRIHVRRR